MPAISGVPAYPKGAAILAPEWRHIETGPARKVLTTRIQAWDYLRDLLSAAPRRSRSTEVWSQDFGVAASPETTRAEARRGSQKERASRLPDSTPRAGAVSDFVGLGSTRPHQVDAGLCRFLERDIGGSGACGAELWKKLGQGRAQGDFRGPSR